MFIFILFIATLLFNILMKYDRGILYFFHSTSAGFTEYRIPSTTEKAKITNRNQSRIPKKKK